MTNLERHRSTWILFAKNTNVTTKSLDTFSRRISEGSAFLTKTLPQLGKALDKALTTGVIDITSCSFKPQKDSALPSFLYELFIKVFEKDGTLRENPEQIAELRQLLFVFYKFDDGHFSEETAQQAYAKFIDTDHLVKTDDWPDSISRLAEIFQSLLPNDPRDIIGRHSNGATADGTSLRMRRFLIDASLVWMKYLVWRIIFSTQMLPSLVRTE